MADRELNNMGVTGAASAQMGIEVEQSPWARVCDKFKHEFGEHAYKTWLGQLGYNGVDAGTVELSAPTKFVRDWIQRHYAPRIQDFFAAEDPRIRTLSIRLSARKEIQRPNSVGRIDEVASARSAISAPIEEGAALDPKYTFDSFVEGKSNQLAKR